MNEISISNLNVEISTSHCLKVLIILPDSDQNQTIFRKNELHQDQ